MGQNSECGDELSLWLHRWRALYGPFLMSSCVEELPVFSLNSKPIFSLLQTGECLPLLLHRWTEGYAYILYCLPGTFTYYTHHQRIRSIFTSCQNVCSTLKEISETLKKRDKWTDVGKLINKYFE